MIKEETSALIDSSAKPNSGYSWIHHFHKVSLTDDISLLHLNEYNVVSAGLGHMCPIPQNGFFQCF